MTHNSLLKSENSFDAQLFRAFFDQSPDGILVTDRDGHLIEFNEAAHKALGYTRSEFEHLDLAALNGMPDAEQALLHQRRVMEEGCAVFETRQKTKDGDTRDVQVSTKKLTLTGRILFHTIWHDISDRTRIETKLQESIRNLEQEKAKTEAIIGAIGEGVSIRDRDFRIMYQNQATIDGIGDHTGEACYQAIQGRVEICEGCPVALAFKDGKTHKAEMSVATKHGPQNFEICASPIRDGSGRIIAAVELSRNITEKKQAEEALKEANSRMEALINAIPDMVLFKDAQRRWLVVNEAVEKTNGLRREQVLGKVDEEIIPPEVAAMCRASDEKAMQADGPVHSEESIVGEDGETIYLDTIKAPVHDQQGNLAGLVVVSRDITKRRKMEEALQRSTEHIRMAHRMAKVGNWEWTLGKDELYWSKEIYRIYGQEPEHFTPTFTAVQTVMHPEDLEPFQHGLEEALHQGKPFEMDYRFFRPDGAERTIHAIGEAAYDSEGRPLGMSGTVQDITAQKRLEAKAWEQFATLESIIKSMENPIYSVDRDYCYTSFNPCHAEVMRKSYGASIELGKSILDFIPGEKDRHQAKLGLDRALNGENVLLEEYFGQGKETRLWEASYNPIRGMDGKVLGVSLYARDTTERRRADEQLKASEKRLRDITANLGVGLYVMDIRGEITFMNPMAEQLWGWSLEELNEKGSHDLVHNRRPDGRPLPLEQCEILGVIKKGKPFVSKDEVYVRKDGTVFPISVIATPLLENGKVVASVTAFRDISTEIKLEEELLKIHKLESVGILAGGIAHDFNNLLQAIMGSISLAQLHLEQLNLAALPPLLKQAEDSSEAAKELSFRLLTFAKGGSLVKKAVSIEGIIRKSVSLSLSGSNIECDFDLSSNLAPVKVDEGQLMQVFNNVFINAKEAMPKGGTISINAQKITIRKNSTLPLKPGKYLHISIRDSGCGIPRENLSKIFDPYFSMKGMGSKKGTGLGLSISMAIVRKHDGFIGVESTPGQGATFHIYIPSSTEPVSDRIPEEEKTSAIFKKRILFMDDDERVRQLVGEMMTSQGCEVEYASHGEEAIALYRQSRDEGRPFDCAILDLTVKGGMGGEKAVAELKKIDPQVKAVIASGYAEDPIIKNFTDYGFVGSISKPFAMNQLKELLSHI